MPRAGLTGNDVVASAAGLADEIGFQGVTIGLLASWPTFSTGWPPWP